MHFVYVNKRVEFSTFSTLSTIAAKCLFIGGCGKFLGFLLEEDMLYSELPKNEMRDGEYEPIDNLQRK